MRTFQDGRPCLGQDPFVIEYANEWLLVESVSEKKIIISSLENLQSAKRVKSTIVWDHPNEWQVWAPELHQIGGLWYIFYAASDGDNATHRNYVLESVAPLGPYLYLGPTGPDIWGIDLTVFRWYGTNYAVWSGWEKNGDEFPQSLYIAEMESPTRLGERVRLASPSYHWEMSRAPIMEGPQAAKINNRLYLFYSANASWTTDYSTGMMELTGTNPLNPRHWVRSTRCLPNVGHGMVAGDRFIYHRKMTAMPGWTDREIVSMELLGLKQVFKGMDNDQPT